MRTFEDAMLARIDRQRQRERLLVALGELTPIQQMTIILLWLGWQPHEIAAVGGRHPNGLQYHKEALKQAVGNIGNNR